VTVYNKNVSRQCDLVANIEQMYDKMYSYIIEWINVVYLQDKLYMYIKAVS
jgi:hypothetical protein